MALPLGSTARWRLESRGDWLAARASTRAHRFEARPLDRDPPRLCRALGALGGRVVARPGRPYRAVHARRRPARGSRPEWPTATTSRSIRACRSSAARRAVDPAVDVDAAARGASTTWPSDVDAQDLDAVGRCHPPVRRRLLRRRGRLRRPGELLPATACWSGGRGSRSRCRSSPMEVGRRIGLDRPGVGMPGHFLVVDRLRRRRFLDPFVGGRMLDRADAASASTSSRPRAPFTDAYLDPDGRRARPGARQPAAGSYARRGEKRLLPRCCGCGLCSPAAAGGGRELARRSAVGRSARPRPLERAAAHAGGRPTGAARGPGPAPAGQARLTGHDLTYAA